MSDLEGTIQARIRLRLGAEAPHVRLFRNTTGEGWQGKVLRRHANGDVLLRKPRYVTFGLAPGSSDLLGLTSIVVTPEMVGHRVAVFTSPEIKRPGERPDPDQTRWLTFVDQAGGIAGVVTDPAEALALVDPVRFSGRK